MSVAELIAPHVPSVRHFARVLYGSQREGDQRVTDCLQSIIDKFGHLAFDQRPKVELFRAFLDGLGPVRTRQPNPCERTPQTTLNAMSVEARIAFLLTSFERFSVSQAAYIMNVAQRDMTRYLDMAASEIASQTATSVLIIEDDPLIALDIEALVQGLGHEVTGVARTRREAVMLARKLDPGLVLTDIQLADDSSGIEAVGEFLSDVEAPVIFVTAYPQMLLRGEGTEPAFLVTKPFEEAALKAMINQVLLFHNPADRARGPALA